MREQAVCVRIVALLLALQTSACDQRPAAPAATAPTTAPATTQPARPITLTPAAASEIAKIIQQQHLDRARTLLQVGVKGGGSTGFQYVLDLNQNEPSKDDIVFESQSIRIRVDEKSYLYLNGTTIDFAEKDGSRGFLFKNPNAQEK